MNILSNKRPNIEPCGIPRQISEHLQHEETTIVLSSIKLMLYNRKLRLPISNPYASNFTINNSCDK